MGRPATTEELAELNAPRKRAPTPEELAELNSGERAPMSATQSAVRGFAQGGTLGFSDEIGAGLQTGLEAIRRAASGGKVPTDSPLGDYYAEARRGNRDDEAVAKRSNPWTYGATEIAGSLAVPVPGAGVAKGATMATRIGKGAASAAAIGAVSGAGKSEAEDFGDISKDAGKNALVSAPFGAAAGYVGSALGKLSDRFGAKVAAGEQRAEDIVKKKAIDAYESARGALGGKVTAGRNAREVMEEIIANPQATARQKSDAQFLIDDPRALEMAHRVYDNAIQAFPQRIGAIDSARRAVVEASDSLTPDAIAASKTQMLADPVKNVVIPSAVGRIKRHLVPGLVTAATGAAGEFAGHALGLPTAMGGAAGLGLGKLVGVSTRELLKHPAVSTGIARAGRGLSGVADDAATMAIPRIAGEEYEGDKDELIHALRKRFGGGSNTVEPRDIGEISPPTDDVKKRKPKK